MTPRINIQEGQTGKTVSYHEGGRVEGSAVEEMRDCLCWVMGGGQFLLTVLSPPAARTPPVRPAAGIRHVHGELASLISLSVVVASRMAVVVLQTCDVLEF